MKRLIFLFGLIAVSLALPVNGQQTVKRFVSVTGNFNVLLPGSDSDEKPSDDGYIGNGSVTSVDGRTTYIVSYSCYCDSMDRPEVIKSKLDNIAIYLQSKPGYALTSQQDISLEPLAPDLPTFQGREFKVESSTNQIIYHAYVVETTVYQLIVISDKGGLSPPEAQTFFSSFHLAPALQSHE